MAARDIRFGSGFDDCIDELICRQSETETEDELSSSDESLHSGKLRWGFVSFGAIVGVILVVALGRVAAQRPSDATDGFLAGPSQSGYQQVSDSDGDLALERFEKAAVTVSADWRPQVAGLRPSDKEIIPRNHTMTVYHQTSPEACQGILKSNFRLGQGGWCGKGIYFAMSPEETRQKAVAPGSGHGCMLEVEVDVGRIQRFKSCGRYNKMNLQRLHSFGYDSILFEPPEKTGVEVIIFEPKRVLKKKIIPFNSSWMAKRWYGKPR